MQIREDGDQLLPYALSSRLVAGSEWSLAAHLPIFLEENGGASPLQPCKHLHIIACLGCSCNESIVWEEMLQPLVVRQLQRKPAVFPFHDPLDSVARGQLVVPIG